MFLNNLDEIEKNMFLALSIHAANANGDFNEKEEELIKSYCYEMNVLFFNPGKICSLDEIIAYFKKAEETVKRIIAIELIGLLNADGSFDDEERSFSKCFFDSIGLKDSTVSEITNAVTDYFDAANKLQYLLID